MSDNKNNNSGFDPFNFLVKRAFPDVYKAMDANARKAKREADRQDREQEQQKRHLGSLNNQLATAQRQLRDLHEKAQRADENARKKFQAEIDAMEKAFDRKIRDLEAAATAASKLSNAEIKKVVDAQAEQDRKAREALDAKRREEAAADRIKTSDLYETVQKMDVDRKSAKLKISEHRREHKGIKGAFNTKAYRDKLTALNKASDEADYQYNVAKLVQKQQVAKNTKRRVEHEKEDRDIEVKRSKPNDLIEAVRKTENTKLAKVLEENNKTMQEVMKEREQFLAGKPTSSGGFSAAAGFRNTNGMRPDSANFYIKPNGDIVHKLEEQDLDKEAQELPKEAKITNKFLERIAETEEKVERLLHNITEADGKPVKVSKSEKNLETKFQEFKSKLATVLGIAGALGLGGAMLGNAFNNATTGVNAGKNADSMLKAFGMGDKVHDEDAFNKESDAYSARMREKQSGGDATPDNRSSPNTKSPFVSSPADTMMRSIMKAETGNAGAITDENRFIRTRVTPSQNGGRSSSAYGPIQITKGYWENFKKQNYDKLSDAEKVHLDKLIDQGQRMLRNPNDPVLGYGGKGELGATEHDRQMYGSLAQKSLVSLAQHSRSYAEFIKSFRGEHDGGYFAKVAAAAAQQGTNPEELYNNLKNMKIEDAGKIDLTPKEEPAPAKKDDAPAKDAAPVVKTDKASLDSDKGDDRVYKSPIPQKPLKTDPTLRQLQKMTPSQFNKVPEEVRDRVISWSQRDIPTSINPNPSPPSQLNEEEATPLPSQVEYKPPYNITPTDNDLTSADNQNTFGNSIGAPTPMRKSVGEMLRDSGGRMNSDIRDASRIDPLNADNQNTFKNTILDQDPSTGKQLDDISTDNEVAKTTPSSSSVSVQTSTGSSKSDTTTPKKEKTAEVAPADAHLKKLFAGYGSFA